MRITAWADWVSALGLNKYRDPKIPRLTLCQLVSANLIENYLGIWSTKEALPNLDALS